MEKQINKKLIPIIMIIAIIATQASIDIYLPSMPAIKQYFHTSASMTQLSLTALLLGSSLPQIIVGPLADRFGRRPMFIFGVSLFLFSSIFCIFSKNIETFLVARFLQGSGCATISVLFRASFRDVFSGEALVRAFSLVAIIWSCTPIFAPVLGGFIQTYLGWKANFIVLIIAGVLVLLLVIFYFPETQSHQHRQNLRLKTIIKNYQTLLVSRNFLGFSLIALIALGFLFGFSTAAPFILQTHLGLTPIQYSFATLFVAFGYMLGAHINRNYSQYIKAKTVLLYGPISMLVINIIAFSLALSGNFSVAMFIIPSTALFLCLGFIYPHCMTGAMTFFPHISGIAGALFGTINFLGTSTITAVIAHLPGHSLTPINLLFLIMSAISVVIYFSITAKIKMPD